MAHEKAADEAEHQDTPEEGDDAAGKSGDERNVDRAAQIAEEAKTDAADAFQRSGLSGMTDEQKQALSDSIGQKVRDGTPLSAAESDFVRSGGLSPAGGAVDSPAQNVNEPLPTPPISKGDNKAMTPPEKAPQVPQAPKAGHSSKAGSSTSTQSTASAKQAASLESASADVASKYEQVGLSGLTPTETNTMQARIVRKVQNGTALTPTETSFVQDFYGK